MAVNTQHSEYAENYAAWELVEDACSGEKEIKEKGTVYLPQPNPTDRSPANLARYEQYKARAVYYNATRRTLQGLIGAAFAKPQTLTVPPLMNYVTDDIDGAGLSIYQQSQAALSEILQKGRAGLLADYPQTSAPTSLADLQSGRIRATAALYEAESIVNWRTEKVGANHVLSLVVINECVEVVDEDGFGSKDIEQYRALRLIDGVYVIEIWRFSDKTQSWELHSQNIPLNSRGMAWGFIPFTFVGSESNSTACDSAPLYDIATLNLAHYRNSADYEDSVYMTGQPQAWISGLTEEWRDWLQEQGIYVGARSAMLLPENGNFGIAQAQPNTLAKEAMDAKEQQMRALGARLIQPGSAVKTATQAQAENESDHSVLSLAAANVSEAYTMVLGWMGEWMGVSGQMEYAIHVESGKFSVDGVMLGSLVAANQAGKLPDSDLFRIMRMLDVIDPEKTDESIREELAASGTAGLNFGGAA
jgi:hypothetical protein